MRLRLQHALETMLFRVHFNFLYEKGLKRFSSFKTGGAIFIVGMEELRLPCTYRRYHSLDLVLLSLDWSSRGPTSTCTTLSAARCRSCNLGDAGFSTSSPAAGASCTCSSRCFCSSCPICFSISREKHLHRLHVLLLQRLLVTFLLCFSSICSSLLSSLTPSPLQLAVSTPRVDPRY